MSTAPMMTKAPSPASQIGTSERLRAVDGLRAVAVLLVFAHHSYFSVLPGGFIGVDLFFVISGFVITRSLVSDGIDFRRFYIHRFFRIIPPMVPVLLFVAIGNAVGLRLAAGSDIWLSLFAMMGWARALEFTDGEFLGHFWSLGIEEQFYFIWPLLLYLTLRQGKGGSVVRVLAVLLAAAVAWQLWFAMLPGPWIRIYNGLDTRVSQLLMGCMLFFLLPLLRISAIWAVLAGASMLVVAFTIKPDSVFYLTIGIPFVGLLSAVVVGFAATNRNGLLTIFETKPVQWLGTRSYAIYLWHWPLIGALDAIGDTFGARRFMVIIAAFVLTLLASEISYRIVERPAVGLRNRLQASLKGTADTMGSHN